MIVAAAQAIANDRSIPVEERIVRTIMSLNVSDQEEGSEIMIEYLHKPQNALMHRQMNQIMMQRIPPVLAGIIKDGIKEGIFRTPYLLECMELTFIYLNTISDNGIFDLAPEQHGPRIKALIFHFEKLLDEEQVEAFRVLSFLEIASEQIVVNGKALAVTLQDNGLSTQSEKFDYLLEMKGNPVYPSEGELYAPVFY